MIIPCCEDLIELKSDHNHKIIEITENAGKCLLDEYVVSFYYFNLHKTNRETRRFQTLLLFLESS